MKLKNILVILFCGIAVHLFGQSHGDLQSLYSKYVSSQGVNYKAMKADADLLSSYCEQLGENVPAAHDRSATAKAYWINVYNAFTLKLVLDNIPLKSITDLHDGKPWDVDWISLDGSLYNLNQIEKEILVKGFKDPRVHFAINCAARSCPPLSTLAFTDQNVEDQLEVLTKAFVQDIKFNQVAEDRAHLSKIFEWYASDFGDVAAFVAKYGLPGFTGITYNEYDWALNIQP